MSAPLWMPLYVRDFVADTQHLSCLQRGAYIALICHYWLHGGLPDDIRLLQKITGLNPHQWRWNGEAIASLFQPGWRHKRVDAELEKARMLSEKRALLGAIGGRYNKGMNNQQRRLHAIKSEAVPKAKVAQHKESKKEADGKGNGLSISLSLAETIKAKGWA